MKNIIFITVALFIACSINDGAALVINKESSQENVINDKSLPNIFGIINGLSFAGQFLWDNAIDPSLTVLQQNALLFIDNYFGNLLNSIPFGFKKDLTIETIKIEKELVKLAYLDESAELVQNLKNTIEKYINELKTMPMVQSSIENTVSRFENQINDLVGLTKQGLSKKLSKSTIQVKPLENELDQNLSRIGNLIVSAFNVIVSSIFSAIFG